MLFIGKEVQERMNSLGLSAEELAEKTFMEYNDIQAIVDNEVALDNIDEFDFSLICSALHCKLDFFTDETVKERDLLVNAMNRGNDNKESMKVKAKIQDFINDFTFVNEILTECN